MMTKWRSPFPATVASMMTTVLILKTEFFLSISMLLLGCYLGYSNEPTSTQMKELFGPCVNRTLELIDGQVASVMKAGHGKPKASIGGGPEETYQG